MLELLSIVEKLVSTGNVQNLESFIQLVEKLITLAETIKSNATNPPASS